MINNTKLHSEQRITLKGIILGLCLIPAHCYWIMMTEIVWYSGHPTIVSLFFNAVFTIFVIGLLNLLLKRFAPRVALNESDLLVIFVMIAIASAICGHDMVEILVPVVGHAFWFASPENEWAQLFHRYLPSWLTVSDKKILEGYYDGNSTIYDWVHIRGWLVPMAWWVGFIFVLLFVMLCFTVIVRRQWTEQEKLSYPIIQLPLELSSNSVSFFRNRTMWIAFAIGCGIDLINGMRYFYPMIPEIPVRRRYITLFTEKPWNAIGSIPISFYPFVIGLGFFIPLDLSFSCWFFFWVLRAENVLASILGLRSLPGFPYVTEQAAGAYLGLGLIAIWATRGHLKRVFRVLFRPFTSFEGKSDKVMDDSHEPLRYRTAVIGLFVGFILLITFCVRAGMGVKIAVVFFALYFLLAIAISRMRAELGTPVHDLHYAGPEQMLTKLLGTRRIAGADLTIMSLFWFITRAYRSHPMPHQLEGFKMAERIHTGSKRLAWAIILATVVGAIASFWALLHYAYRFGASSRIVGPALTFGREPFNRLQTWLYHPTEANIPATSFTLLGIGITIFLAVMRTRFVWWLFHPAGYAVSSSWGMNVFWMCLFMSWLIKGIILRFGGIRTHRRVVPFFLGLILGECVARSIWALLSVIFSIPTGTGHW